MKLKSMGVLAGVADLVLVCRAEVIFIEVKTQTGRVQDTQFEFRERVTDLGHPYHIVRSVEEYGAVLKAYSVPVYGKL